MKRALFRLIAASIMMSGVTGCTSISYYAQSLQGHVEIMAARKSVAGLIDDPSTPEPLRARMEEASAIRQFATDELGLPDNNSYRSYVDIGRDYVTGCRLRGAGILARADDMVRPGLRLRSLPGIFLQGGRGRNGSRAAKRGLDVHVSGITAYSTLGWSSDPLLSTMLRQDETYLAGADLSRAGPPARLCERRFRIQRGLRGRRRNDGREEMAAAVRQPGGLAPL